MRDAGIGRLLVASLHQGIADRLPDRLEFYENWLNPRGLRDGTIGLAPLHAVLSFLRTEGEDYGRVTTAAGEYAAEWAVAELPAFRRWAATSLPGPLRRRVALGVVQRLVTSTYTASRTRVRMHRRSATLEIRNSIFCGVRDRVPAPLCQFYAAAAGRLLATLGHPAAVRIASCQATGDGLCHVELDLSGGTEEGA
jgi:bacteriochlorophyll 4-vinyl reductase